MMKERIRHRSSNERYILKKVYKQKVIESVVPDRSVNKEKQNEAIQVKDNAHKKCMVEVWHLQENQCNTVISSTK